MRSSPNHLGSLLDSPNSPQKVAGLAMAERINAGPILKSGQAIGTSCPVLNIGRLLFLV
jgi:hypothetical protein